MQETDRLDQYILEHIDEESEYLKALYRDTHVKLLRPRMASGHLQRTSAQNVGPHDTSPAYSGNRNLQRLFSPLHGKKALNRTVAYTPLKSMTNRRISPDHG